MDNFRGGDNHLGGEIGGIQIFHNPLGHHLGRTLPGNHRLQGAIRVIFMGIEAGHIHALDFGHFPKELLLAPRLPLGFLIEGDNFHGAVLSLAGGEEVDKLRQRFRIKGADATGKHHIVQPLTLGAVDGHAGQPEHIDNVGIGHFIADGKGNHVEILHRLLTFQRPQRQLLVTHFFLHVAPGRKHPLAPHALHLVHNAVQNPHSHIGHTDFIGIREAERHPDIHFLAVFLNFSPLAAGVTRRFLHRREDSFDLFGHRLTSWNIMSLLYYRFFLIASSF